jgi:hypothetical protein
MMGKAATLVVVIKKSSCGSVLDVESRLKPLDVINPPGG